MGECGVLGMRGDSRAPGKLLSKYRIEIPDPESNYFHVQDKD